MQGAAAAALQATSLVEVPYLMAQSLLMVLIIYWMVGFQTTGWQVGRCSRLGGTSGHGTAGA